MACCGQKRNAFSNHSSHQMLSNIMFNDAPSNNTRDAQFEYTGSTALTAIGSITGKRYRFSHPGDIQIVDYRDVPLMMGIGSLKKLVTQE